MKPLVRAALALLLLTGVATAAETAPVLPKLSPFAQRATAGSPTAAANENVELAGISTVGPKTELIFYDKTTKKSYWISKGETKEGIAVLNYDEPREQAVVKINGVEKVLSLRRVNAGAPRPVAALPTGFNTPAASTVPIPAVVNGDISAPPAATIGTAPNAPAAPPTTQAKQETEARMLVSDLLEIGMAQRRAYEEAQRKAADGTARTPTPAAPPSASSETPRP